MNLCRCHIFVPHLLVIGIAIFARVTCKFTLPFASLLQSSSSANPSVTKIASLFPNPLKLIHKASTIHPATVIPPSYPFGPFSLSPYDFEREGDWTWNNVSFDESHFDPPPRVAPKVAPARRTGYSSHGAPASRVASQELKKRNGDEVVRPYLYEISNGDKSDQKILEKIPALAIAHSGYPGQVGKLAERTDQEHDFCAHCPPKIKVIKVKVKSKPKVIYKLKKVYVPKKVIKKVPKIVIKEKIKIVPIVKKVPVIKKIKVPVPYKVKYIKVKKIKVPVIKKIKVPVIKKVIKYKTKKVKHVHVHKISLKKKKKKKMGMFKKMKMKMLKKKLKKMQPDCYSYKSSCGCQMCPCPVSPLALLGRRRRSLARFFSSSKNATTRATVNIGEKATFEHGIPVTIDGHNMTDDTNSQIYLKRTGLMYSPLGRLSDECNEYLASQPIQRLDSADDGQGEEEEGEDEEEEEMAMRRRKRSLHRQLLLGPRVTWFDSQGWSFSHPTVSFYHPP